MENQTNIGKSKRVSVVILNWNGCDLMREFLPSVINNSPPDIADIVVADNGSTDDSISMLHREFPSVNLILLDKNYGFAEGYNQALARITTEYAVLLNSDVEVMSGWLKVPLAILDNDPKVACVQPKILAQRNKNYFEYAGAAGGYLDRYGYPFCRGRLFHVVEEDKGQYDNDIDILWGSGACLFVRTDVYKKEGGLDKVFFAHQEEIDFCWRLRNRGYRIIYTAQSTVFHVGGATLDAESPHKTFLNFRNNLLMLYKNLPEKELPLVMRRRFFLDYLAAVQFALTGHFKNAKAVFKARQAFFELKSTAGYKITREENQKKTVLPGIPEILPYSLITLFYIKKKHTFSDIYHFFNKKS